MMTNFQKLQQFHRHFELPRPLRATALPLSVKTVSHELPEPWHMIARMKDAMDHVRAARNEDDVLAGRIQMMLEELIEFAEANDLEHAADALVDLVYFALGTADLMGIPFDECFNEVHRANMTKVRVKNAEESTRLNKLDVRKPEGFCPPDLEPIIHGPRYICRDHHLAPGVKATDYVAVEGHPCFICGEGLRRERPYR